MLSALRWAGAAVSAGTAGCMGTSNTVDNGIDNQAPRVAGAGDDRELPGLDARDVDEVPEEPVHAGGGAEDLLRRAHGRALRAVMESLALDDLSGEAHGAEQRAQIMADDAQEVVAMRDRLVDVRPFG